MLKLAGPPRLPEPYNTIHDSFFVSNPTPFQRRIEGNIYRALGFHLCCRPLSVLKNAISSNPAARRDDILDDIDTHALAAIGSEGAMRLARALNQTQI